MISATKAVVQTGGQPLPEAPMEDRVMTSILLPRSEFGLTTTEIARLPHLLARFGRGGLGPCSVGGGGGDVEYLRGLLGYDYQTSEYEEDEK
jgi:hypothetical protein